jgi:O-antigen/teichoic acid export membrane protein
MSTFLQTLLARLTGGVSLRARLARATAWMIVGNGVNQAVLMIASIGTARILGKTGFGEFGAVRSTTLTLAVLAGGGLGLAATRYVASLRSVDPERAGRLIRLIMTVAWTSTGVAAFLCVVLAHPLATHLVKAEKLTTALMLSSVAIIFSTVGGVQIGVLAGCEAFKPMAVLLVVEGFAAGVFLMGGAWLGGVTGAIAGYVAGTVIAFVLRHRQMGIECRRVGIPNVPLRASGARSELPIFVSFVLPTVLLVVGYQPSEWFVRMLLARGPDGMSELGIFTAAYSWAQIVQFMPSQIAGPAMPILASVFASGDTRAFRRLLAESLTVVFVAAAMIAIPIGLWSKFVMRFYGPSFLDGAPVLTIIVLAYVISAISYLLRLSFLSLGRAWLSLIMTFGWGVVLPVSFIFLRKNGALGLAQSYAIAFLLLTIAQAIAAWVVFRRTPSQDPAMKIEVANGP